MERKPEDISLFDMDGTLCDYDRALAESLEKMRAPSEPECKSFRNAPEYLIRRMDIIRSFESWWKNLPRLKLGWDILEIAQSLDFRIVVLTQGPRKNPAAWSGKKKWIDRNLGEDTDIIITRDKGLVYGKVFVDDFPEYVERWLEWRKNGLVIMPANESNKNYHHKQVIRYNGNNYEQVSLAMKQAKDR